MTSDCMRIASLIRWASGSTSRASTRSWNTRRRLWAHICPGYAPARCSTNERHAACTRSPRRPHFPTGTRRQDAPPTSAHKAQGARCPRRRGAHTCSACCRGFSRARRRSPAKRVQASQASQARRRRWRRRRHSTCTAGTAASSQAPYTSGSVSHDGAVASALRRSTIAASAAGREAEGGARAAAAAAATAHDIEGWRTPALGSSYRSQCARRLAKRGRPCGNSGESGTAARCAGRFDREERTRGLIPSSRGQLPRARRRGEHLHAGVHLGTKL